MIKLYFTSTMTKILWNSYDHVMMTMKQHVDAIRTTDCHVWLGLSTRIIYSCQLVFSNMETFATRIARRSEASLLRSTWLFLHFFFFSKILILFPVGIESVICDLQVFALPTVSSALAKSLFTCKLNVFCCWLSVSLQTFESLLNIYELQSLLGNSNWVSHDFSAKKNFTCK